MQSTLRAYAYIHLTLLSKYSADRPTTLRQNLNRVQRYLSTHVRIRTFYPYYVRDGEILLLERSTRTANIPATHTHVSLINRFDSSHAEKKTGEKTFFFFFCHEMTNTVQSPHSALVSSFVSIFLFLLPYCVSVSHHYLVYLLAVATAV